MADIPPSQVGNNLCSTRQTLALFRGQPWGDGWDGTEHIWAFPSTTMPSWTETKPETKENSKHIQGLFGVAFGSNPPNRFSCALSTHPHPPPNPPPCLTSYSLWVFFIVPALYLQAIPWGDCWEMGQSAYGPFRALPCYLKLKLNLKLKKTANTYKGYSEKTVLASDNPRPPPPPPPSCFSTTLSTPPPLPHPLSHQLQPVGLDCTCSVPPSYTLSNTACYAVLLYIYSDQTTAFHTTKSNGFLLKSVWPSWTVTVTDSANIF